MPKKTTDTAAKTEKVVAKAKVETPLAAAKPAAKVVKKVTPAAGKPTAKTATIKKFQRSANDTGSTAVQIAVLSEKIGQLSKHLSEHKKDNDSRMGLLKMISHRRGLLSYLEKKEPEDYRKLLATLGLRK